MERSEIPHDASHLGVPSGVLNDFRAYGMFGANRAPILHRHWLPTDRYEIPLDPRHLGVPSGMSKMISEPMVCSTQTVQLSCVKISMISEWGELSLEPRHLGAPSGASKAISKLMVRFGAKCAPILHRHLHSLQMERSEIPHDPCHLGVPLGASKRFPSLWHIRRKPCSYLAS